MTAVLTLQLAGWAYQPPAGDQTSLGYLSGELISSWRDLRYGTDVRDLSASTHFDECAIEENWGEKSECRVDLEVGSRKGRLNRRSGAKALALY